MADVDFVEVQLSEQLPEKPLFQDGIRRAPRRNHNLSEQEIGLALSNALRYLPPKLHPVLAPEFLTELKTRGRIYAYRYRPRAQIKAHPIEEYQGNTLAGKAIQLMIDNNLPLSARIDR